MTRQAQHKFVLKVEPLGVPLALPSICWHSKEKKQKTQRCVGVTEAQAL